MTLQRNIHALEGLAHKCIHITSLRFPNYKMLAHGEKLTFTYPITVLLGRNGTNKSSILHALYGAPRNKSIAEYWFETKVDGIPETRNGLKQSVTHSYINSDGDEVECIKARAPRFDDPDYWEPVKPTQRYGFPPNSERISPIELDALYLDFRGQLPAFDKYFYFPDEKHLEKRRQQAAKRNPKRRRHYRKQDYLRNRSRILRHQLDNALRLDENELDAVNRILQQDYIEGIIHEHDLFHGHRGTTVLFRTNMLDTGYSEAFAGSGEAAIAILIYRLKDVPSKSLILLDEPETSLHPEAQKRLLEHLAKIAVVKKLQIVFATHSIHLAEPLPQSAIRVLVRDSSSGLIRISENYTVQEALHEIDSRQASHKIFVEDKRARHLLKSAIETFAPHAMRDLDIIVAPGGTSFYYRDIWTQARAKSTNIIFVLDGDHRPTAQIPDQNQLPQGIDELHELIDTMCKGNNSRAPDFLKSDNAESCTEFINYFRKFVTFLPGATPEDLVWNDDVIKHHIKQGFDEIMQLPCTKGRIAKTAELVPGLRPDTVYEILVSKFLTTPSDERKNLESLVEQIRGLK